VLTYLVPLRAADDDDVDDLAAYLRALAEHVDVLVVDGSSEGAMARHRTAFGPGVRLVSTEHRTLMGKVGNVLTGLRHAHHDKVVIADDDVRYTVTQLDDIERRLDAAEVVRPQNYFTPRPWHARFDTARSLLARVSGGDWPGTLAVQRSCLQRVGGYAGDVMFENLELVRTVRAAGGREHVALDLLIERRPPTTQHFLGQQVRQAYDEFARPARLTASLLVLPLSIAAVLRGRRQTLVIAGAAAVAAAEIGRRRAGGRRHFPASSTLLVPAWLLWRSACSWAALIAFARGGVRYRDARIKRAASPMRQLRRTHAVAPAVQHERRTG
jgi:Glycosyl transferase family 21